MVANKLYSCYNKIMKCFSIVFALYLISLCGPALAGGGICFARPVSKTLSSQEIRLQQVISSNMDLSILNSRVARLAAANRQAYLHAKGTLPFKQMAPVSAPLKDLPQLVDPIFISHNDKMALQWFEPIEKDLHFLRDQNPVIKRTIQIRHADPQTINYADLIPPQARKIFVGEEHYQPAIYQAVEKMILQYQQKYPQKEIILLTEFVSDRLFSWQKPGQPVGQLEMLLRRNDKNFAFFNQLMKAGITIIGLESIDYIKDHESLITSSESQNQSVYGIQERNAHWRNIISYVSDQHPDAVLFIYAGSMHTHYRAPFSLATPSPQNFVLQLESGYLGADMPFGYIMKEAPFTKANNGQLTILNWDKKGSVFRIRSGFDTCIIFPTESR